MKADQYGTLAEQKRFSIGYRRPSEMPRSEVERAVQPGGGCANFLLAQTRPKVERP